MNVNPSETTTSDLRSFGLLMAGVFLVVTLWPLVIRGESIRVWAAIITGAFGGDGNILSSGAQPPSSDLDEVW